MNRRIPFLGLLGFILVVPSLAEDIYKWEDADGQTHYSDVPKAGAVEVEIHPVQTFSLPTAASTPTDKGVNTEADVNAEADLGYQIMAITKPGQEESIWNTGGKVTVSLNLQPGLKAGHSIRLYMDGQLLADLPPRATSLRLSDVYRGKHQLQAEVQDKKGNVLIKASPVTFFYHQTSVNRRPGSIINQGPNF
ncbi:MAG: DUF4124 domain-containing protein [Gammaproteobacteria bacterium]|nr:DUF4124 domain-containing protein [Gammaproteobacteria bacterium]MCP4090900.1 DUF4124 domain-containing protein [Gammaproteobacteria bacterium]MCP4275187.1 DUF4124 domain-containing protein [Gammaproteobacteria bacterium]MCP4830803.1 DUF4124 domain-containing protein [Gammaproteobacteria bacterium]MCP4929592.1 DUF4124 domain-containing protein [Gammaproteobacteria bacterium]